MNLRKTSVIILAISILASVFIPHAIASRGEPVGKAPEIISERVRVNMTDVVPQRFRHQVAAGEPELLRFKNMVIELNCTRKMTMNISSDNRVRLQYFSINMRTERNVHMDIRANTSPPVDIPEPERGICKYMTIESNSTTPFNATLRLYMNMTELETEMGRTPDMNRLTWCYWNGTDWEPVRSRLTVDGFLETNTTHFSLWSIMERKTVREMELPEIPGISARARAFNYTDVVPEGFRYQVERRQATMLQFNNTALYLNCTNSLELDVSAENQFRQKLIRLDVDAGEALNLRVQLRESKPTEVETPTNHMGFYCEIEPNTTITQARLGMEIDPAQVQAMEMKMEQLSWAYWNGTHWDMVKSTLSEDNILEAETDHFSTWTIIAVEETTIIETGAEPESELEPVVTTEIPILTTYISIGIAVAVFLIKWKNKPVLALVNSIF